MPSVLGYVRRHLQPGGRLIFDTPNRDLTRLVVGEAMLTSDHTYEYSPAETIEVMRANGFEVIRQLGILPMPESAASGDFDWQESQTPDAIVDDPTVCFVFAFECARLG